MKIRRSYRWADQEPLTVHRAVLTTMAPHPDAYDDIEIKANNTRDLLAALIVKLHEKGVFSDAEIIDLLNDGGVQWEVVEESA